MLEIKGVTKTYDTGGLKQKALKGVSINFRKCEFAAILGPSGSGKTTLLNIVGGLDHYTSGDLIIDGVSTKEFKDADWDSYRNHRIGFVFQSYNLIPHQTILANVKLALTLSGISKKEATARAKKALKEVGLLEHIKKKPGQLSGGQMQRVAIARALVNNPDILLADEPTGALDSETSIQIMNLLKKISKDKLVIMVTHNPELAEEYATRTINLKDGEIISDTDPFTNTKEKQEHHRRRTKMSFRTALALSFNNLMTKKGRTILVAFAGSIGIIGIALILAVSTGFQNYVDSIQEDTLTSYPLRISQESTDITGMLLSLANGSGQNDQSGTVVESQYISSVLGNIKANDLKNFKNYLNQNQNKVKDDLVTVKYSYSVDPLIYTIDATNKLAKLNPSNLFSSFYGQSSMMNSYSSLASIYSQMIDDQDIIREQYDILAGHLPENYNEMILVLSEPNTISDLLVYSLGLRDTDELTDMVTKIMSGESVDVHNEPLTISYEELMNTRLKLIEPADAYQYNEKYDVYEDMRDNTDYMQNLYNNAEELKIVGIVSAKEGTTSQSLSPGVAYTSGLVEHIIDYSSKTDVVKKQLQNKEIDIFSGSRFDEKKNKFDFEFSDLVSVDSAKLQNAFGVNIDQNTIKNQTSDYMDQISNSITADITPAKTAAKDGFNTIANNLASDMNGKSFTQQEIPGIVDNYLNSTVADSILMSLETNYLVPKSTFKTIYSEMLKGLILIYAKALEKDPDNPVEMNLSIFNDVKDVFMQDPNVIDTFESIAKPMTEARMKKDILTKVGELTTNLTSSLSSAFHVDQDALISAFSLNFSEEELARVASAMFAKSESSLTTNLVSLGYQDKDAPTSISFYFNSFDGKERFLKFIDSYNEEMKNSGQEDKVLNYSDTTGILMDSVKVIVNAVSYVLIAFVSISLVVSSIMIGVITYISVYERKKEIGILRSIGASKHNVSSIFNAETFIIGLLSGVFAMAITYTLIPLINAILHHFVGNIPLNASLDLTSAIILVILSIFLTLIGGFIPAKAAAKKDPVEALRSE